MKSTRKITNKLIELMEEGALDPEVVAKAALAFMSEADVAEMAEAEELLLEEDLDEDYEDEGDDSYDRRYDEDDED